MTPKDVRRAFCMHTGKYNIGFFLCLVLLITGASFVPGVYAEDQSRDERYTASRHRMVKNQIEARDIRNPDVLEAMKNVPRHRFLTKFINQAYKDHPVPIGYGQTISQPYIVGLMTQELELTSQDRVLEIGTGSGYQAAILAYIVKEVYTIEIIEELAGQAEKLLQSLKYDNIHVMHADGYFGWEEHAPFDAVIITAAANHIPIPLLNQLKVGGKLILPLSSPGGFHALTLIRKTSDGLDTEFVTGVRFVPMTGEAQKTP